MNEAFEREIEKHLDSFPERWKVVAEMREDWEEFRRKFLWTIIGSVGAFIALGVWVGTIQTDHGHFEEEINEHKEQYVSVERRLGTLEVTNSDIKARLSSIEAILLEIKTELVKLR